MDLPGVGFKTADILILFKAKIPVFPLDTHCLRLSQRIGFVESNKNYENVRMKLEEQLPVDYEVFKEASSFLQD